MDGVTVDLSWLGNISNKYLGAFDCPLQGG